MEVEVRTTSVPLRCHCNPDLKCTAIEKYFLIRLGYIGRFREKKFSKPRFLSFKPNEKSFRSRKSKVRHLPFAITLFTKVESMMEELGAEDEAGVSSRAFVLRSHVLMLIPWVVAFQCRS